MIQLTARINPRHFQNSNSSWAVRNLLSCDGVECCLRGHSVRMVVPVSESYAHVVEEDIRDADGEAKAQQSLRESDDIDAAITAEKCAGYGSPDQRRNSERNVGQMCD